MLIRGHDLREHQVSDIKILKDIYSIDGFQLAIKKSYEIKDNRLSDENTKIVDEVVLENSMILGAYFNPVHPNSEIVKDGIENFIFNMKLAEKYGIRYVGTETGSKLGHPWSYHEDNHTSQTLYEAIDVFREISIRTKGIETKIAIEPAYEHVIKDVNTASILQSSLQDNRIVFVMDIFNLLRGREYYDYKTVLQEFVEKAGNSLQIVHLKDFVVEEGNVREVKIGHGIVDFKYLMLKVRKVNANALFVLEGTLEDDLSEAMKIVGE